MLRVLCYKLIEHNYAEGGFWVEAYWWFNILEAIFWCAVGIYMLNRYLDNKKSRWELAYVGLFFLFGLTDVREVADLPVWLLLFKGSILAGIIITRTYLVRNFYRGAKM
jgi:hypothetical protein